MLLMRFFFFYWFLSLVTGGKHNNWICARILHCCSCFRCRCLCCCCCIAAGVGVEKRAHNTHTQRPQSNPHAETIYKYICITQKFMCACAFVCVCFVGPQLLLAFIFSQLSQSCSSRQLENTHRNKKNQIIIIFVHLACVLLFFSTPFQHTYKHTHTITTQHAY